ncbi:arylamine N-acetyltransferase [Streptomyces albogriseolus]|uniref:arylamine N-acetyltransferase n=1 Tax=Streptomyces TaxID=1883 RepID=UPI001676CE1D|nr:arylamine N-acetyltransferase [Streptomyces sp. CL7]MCI3150379.1 3-amino-5-hydroxybenzoic acid synthase [Streptomyces sp. GB4-14]WPP34455.1 arylamine N-acetyltransferase [Streptomyces sp. CL7]GHF24560.1 proansamycin X synthase [Streptomyces werraensis]
MFDVDRYLARIGCAGETGVDIATLRKLHRDHLMAIPYNGATQDFADGVRLVDLDEDATFETCVIQGRGGTCFQLNRLFSRLLTELGYDVTLLAASTAEGREASGLDVEHMFHRVALDGADWLVDVGYPGPSYVEPLLVTDAVQSQYGCQYRLVDRGSRTALQRRGRITRWSVVYTFTPEARQWSDWKEMEEFLVREIAADTGPRDGRNILCGRTLDNGQAVLKGRRYLTVRDGREETRTITDDDEHQRLVSHLLSDAFG